ERAQGGKALDNLIGYAGVAFDQRAVHRGLTEPPQPGAELLAAAAGLLSGARMRMDQVQPELSQEQLPAEAGQLPSDLPGLLRYLARLALANLPATSCLLRTHRPSHSSGAHLTYCPKFAADDRTPPSASHHWRDAHRPPHHAGDLRSPAYRTGHTMPRYGQ